jgi:hypothetical protein
VKTNLFEEPPIRLKEILSRYGDIVEARSLHKIKKCDDHLENIYEFIIEFKNVFSA